MADERIKRLTLVAAILGSGIVFLDGTVVNIALPAIRADLDTGLAAQQWIVEAYLLTLGALLMVGGSLGDRLGRRRVFAAGLAGFGATSLMCALAPDPFTLIAARTLQGATGALLVPASLALITAAYPRDRRGWAIGTWTAWTGIAFVLGPLAGGGLVELISWRWVFAVNVPLVAVTLAIVRAGVRESIDEEAAGGIDFPGAALASLGLGGPVFALIEQQVYGWGDPRVWGPMAGGLLMLVAFVQRERTCPRPMLPLELFRIRNFTIGNVSTLGVYGGLGAATFFATIFLQQVAGYSPVESGLALVPITVVMWLLSPRFGALSDRIGPRVLMGCGPIVAGAGLIWMGRLGSEVHYPTDLLPGVLLFGLGLAATVAPLTSTVLGSVPEHNAGVASGVNNQIARVATLLAIAVVGAVVAARFDGALDSRVADLPPQARAAAGEAEALSGGSSRRPPVERAIESASVAGYRTGMAVGGGMAILGGLISLAGIVNPRPSGEQQRRSERRSPAAAGRG